MQDNTKKVKLTAAELGYLWSTYIADTMSLCVINYFLVHIHDEDIHQLLKHAQDISQQHLEIIRGILTEEGIKIPQGFTEQDVNLQAKRLFSDTFYLIYIHNMTKGGLVTYGRVLQNVFREDIHAFFTKCMTSTLELKWEATKILLEKGLATRPPNIPYPDKIEFIQKQSFMLEGLGRRSILTALEVTNLYANVTTNYLGSSIATAFSQIAKSDKVRKYILRGKEIAIKHAKVFASYLEMSSLPVPMSSDQEVTDSTETVFSDKLIMFLFSMMIYAGIGNYGVAISESQRSDLVVDYSRLLAEIMKYSEDGANIMIAHEWLEQPPISADRRGLAKG